MLSKAYTISLLVAALAGSTEAGHLRNGHSHIKRADICGTKGYDHDKGNYWYDGGGKYNSYAACSAQCLGDPKCLSFAYSNQECMLFNIPLKGNFDADKGSSDTYYDRGCLSVPAVENKPTTTTTSKSSATPAAKTSSSSTPTSSTAATATPSSTPKSSSSPTSNTAAVATTLSSAGGAASTPSTTTSAAPDFPTANPYESKGCPMPKSLAISDLKSTIDSKTGTNTASVKIQYGNGTFSCPGRCGSYDGQFNCVCDSDGLLNVASDGRSWIWVQEWYWCDAQEQRPAKAYQTLALSLNFTQLADYVTCSKSGTNTTCTQSKPLIAPVGGYGGGGTPGFSPIDINGKDLPNCPYRPGHSQIVTDTAACATATAKA